MTAANRFALSNAAAEAYARSKVPAIFGPLAEATLDAVDLREGLDILDVACGPGVVARALARRAPSPGRIVGADLNAAMIEVARREAPELEWIVASADAMPVEDGAFDLVVCQQGLQFFPDRAAALAEMRRALRPGGRVVVTIWAGVPPFFDVSATHVAEVLGEAAAVKSLQPFSWSDADVAMGLIAKAGFAPHPARRLAVHRRLPATKAAVREDLLATPNELALRDRGDAVIDGLAASILEDVAPWREGDRLVLPQSAHLLVATAT